MLVLLASLLLVIHSIPIPCSALQTNRSQPSITRSTATDRLREYQSSPTVATSHTEHFDYDSLIPAAKSVQSQYHSESGLPVIVSTEERSSNGNVHKSTNTADNGVDTVTVTSVVYKTTSVPVIASSNAHESTSAAPSSVAYSNAYQVLSAAEETFSTAASTSRSSGSDFVTSSSHLNHKSTAVAQSSQLSSTFSGALFTLDGVSYTAYRPETQNQLTVVIEGVATTATLSPARPITLPVDEVVFMDLDGQPIVTGSTVQFSALPASVAAVISNPISASRTTTKHPYQTSSPGASSEMGSLRNVTTSSTSPPPSYAVWGNGIPTASSTTSDSANLRSMLRTRRTVALVVAGLAALVLR